MQPDRDRPSKPHFFDRPANVKRLLWGLYALCVLLLVADLFIPMHAEYAWERIPGFYAAFGFVSFVGLVLAGKHVLRRIVKRDEDYYD